MRHALLLSLLLTTQASLAQDASARLPAPPAPASAPPLVQASPEPEGSRIVLDRGEKVRVTMAEGSSHSGALTSLSPEALSLQVSPEQVVSVSWADVRRLETRQRSAGTGAKVGAISGAVAGAIIGGLLCTSSFDSDDNTTVLCGGVGLVLGGALGAGTGTLLGLALPRWSSVYEQEEQGTLVPRLEHSSKWAADGFAGSGLMGEVGLQLGYARGVGVADPQDGVGGRVHMLALLGPHLAAGPELAWYQHIGTETVVSSGGQSPQESRSLLATGVLGRAGLELGPTRPSLLLGLGLQGSGTLHLGLSVGGEVEVQPWQQVPPLALEVRYHAPFSAGSSSNPAERLLILGLGTRIRW